MITATNTPVGEVVISPIVDVIKRYDEEQYDHLVYFDDEEGFRLLFLGQVALAALADAGVPEAFHDKLFESVEEEYIDWEVATMEACEEWSADD